MKVIRINNDIISLDRIKKVETIHNNTDVILVFKYFAEEQDVWSSPVSKNEANNLLDEILKTIKAKS